MHCRALHWLPERLLAALQVRQEELHSWQARQVFFGQSVANICRGMSAARIGQLFQHASICIRGYDLPSGKAHLPCQT